MALDGYIPCLFDKYATRLIEKLVIPKEQTILANVSNKTSLVLIPTGCTCNFDSIANLQGKAFRIFAQSPFILLQYLINPRSSDIL